MGTMQFRHAESVNWSAFLPDGKSIITASFDGTMRWWDVATGKELRRFVGPEDGIELLAVSPDGKRLVSSGGAGRLAVTDTAKIRLWDMASGKEILANR